MIVAHPDDETIWMGGHIMQNPDWEWEVISLCRGNDFDREPKFFRVCEELGARCAISDLDDGENGGELIDIDSEEVVKRIKAMAKSREYNYVFTHGDNGEYGHKRHLDVNGAVKKMIADRDLVCGKVFYFAYEGENEPGKFCNIDKSATKFINLPDEVHARKMKLIKEIYGFNDESFEVKSCREVEAFNVSELR